MGERCRHSYSSEIISLPYTAVKSSTALLPTQKSTWFWQISQDRKEMDRDASLQEIWPIKQDQYQTSAVASEAKPWYLDIRNMLPCSGDIVHVGLFDVMNTNCFTVNLAQTLWSLIRYSLTKNHVQQPIPKLPKALIESIFVFFLKETPSTGGKSPHLSSHSINGIKWTNY